MQELETNFVFTAIYMNVNIYIWGRYAIILFNIHTSRRNCGEKNIYCVWVFLAAVFQ